MKKTIDLSKYEFKGQFQLQISNHPKSGLIRVIDYFGANISEKFKIIDHDADMLYFNQKGEPLPEFTHKVRQRGRDWKVDNSYEVFERNPQGEPVLDEAGNPIKHPAYEYFIKEIYSNPTPLKDILQNSIHIDDKNNLFDEGSAVTQNLEEPTEEVVKDIIE